MPEFNPALDILPEPQRRLWNRMGELAEREFVLYGGTALALHLHHRESVDFDFFTSAAFSPSELHASLGFLRKGRVIQNLENTLTVAVNDGADPVRCSFFGALELRCVEAPVRAPNGIAVAGIRDIFGCKCAAVQSREEPKDYIDIQEILTRGGYTLSEGVGFAAAIYGEHFNPVTTLRALAHRPPPISEALAPGGEAALDAAIASVDLSALPTVQPLGPIGRDILGRPGYDAGMDAQP